ncbi:ATP-dependent nuclease [Flaviflagellibacter deserti]|uniref:ATP-dependent endonuclease n=1 Tax=Flaviflagellibacter deserti TaxID=2267266 RepID=A0ABV9YVR7_9HYPH
MQIGAVTIENFRSIQNLRLELMSHSVVLGSNNAGKSTVLKAIDLFFESAPRLTIADHYFSNSNLSIVITIEFRRFTPAERDEFAGAVINDVMTVSRELSATDRDSGLYSVTALVNPAFDEFRNESNGTRKRGIYGRIREDFGLPSHQTADDMTAALIDWERNNPGTLEPRRMRGFFGATNVANGKLKKRTLVRLIPAVRETASEFQDPKRSPVLGLLSDIANQVFQNRRELAEFVDRAREEARVLTDPEGIPQLQNISDDLTRSIHRFYSDTSLEAEWIAAEPLQIVFPTPKVVISHRGARVSVEYVGHGLQRAVLFAIVQFLAERQSSSTERSSEQYSEPLSDIILMIEEPEIYQHPLKQKQIYDAFKEICSSFDPGTGIRIQIIYTTHSEKLISMGEFDSIRIIRKDVAGESYLTRCTSLSLQECSRLMATAANKPNPMPPTTLAAKLHIFTRDVSEGFFAEKVVLVEGGTDKAILEGAYKSMDRNPAAEGISIIAMSGKTTIDKPFLIFSQLGIPTYAVFDNDANKSGRKQHRDSNVLLQRLGGVQEPEDFPEGVFDRFAVIPGDLERYLSTVLGNAHDELMGGVCEEFELGYDDLRKTPQAVSALLVSATARNFHFQHLTDIIEAVDRLN